MGGLKERRRVEQNTRALWEGLIEGQQVICSGFSSLVPAQTGCAILGIRSASLSSPVPASYLCEERGSQEPGLATKTRPRSADWVLAAPTRMEARGRDLG